MAPSNNYEYIYLFYFFFRNRRKSRWKLKFHHQALPAEYLNHYEASMVSPQPSPGTSSPSTAVPFIGANNVKSKLPPEAQTSVRFDDLPYMGEMTLDNAKPRRGRKPKKVNKHNFIIIKSLDNTKYK